MQAASKIRVNEVAEDFPWIITAMKPLRGLAIPCPFEEVERRWQDDALLDRLRKDADSPANRLPPKSLRYGLEGLRDDLQELGLFYEARDGRINMPDVYRVGFGLGRKGGVKPVR